MGSFFDDISERAEARRNLSWERQKSLIDSGIATPSLTNGSVDNSLTAEQAQAKTQLQDQKSRQAYSELMALPVGAVEGMLGIGGDVELLGQGIKGAYNADSGNRWEGFKEGLSDRDTMFWSTLDNQERTDQWLEGTEFGDRLKEGAGGRLVGEILAPLPIPKGTSALAKGVGRTVADSLTGTGVSSVNTGMFRGIKNLRDMGKDPAMVIGQNSSKFDMPSYNAFNKEIDVDAVMKSRKEMNSVLPTTAEQRLWESTAKTGNPTFIDIDGIVKQEIPTGEMKLKAPLKLKPEKILENESLASYGLDKDLSIFKMSKAQERLGYDAYLQGDKVGINVTKKPDYLNPNSPDKTKIDTFLAHEGQHGIQHAEEASKWATGSDMGALFSDGINKVLKQGNNARRFKKKQLSDMPTPKADRVIIRADSAQQMLDNGMMSTDRLKNNTLARRNYYFDAGEIGARTTQARQLLNKDEIAKNHYLYSMNDDLARLDKNGNLLEKGDKPFSYSDLPDQDLLEAYKTGVDRKAMSIPTNKADEIDYFEALQEDKFFNNRKELNAPRVNAEGTDNLGYKVRESDYALGNSNDVVDSSLITRASNPNANRFDLADIGEGKFPKDQYIETKPDSFYDSLYKSQNKYGDLVEYDAKKTLERANSKNTDQRNIAEWENVFGKPTGSGKLGADKTVNPDLGLTYDGSEFPASLDPNAVKLTPNGRPTKAPQPEVDPFGDLTDEAFNIVKDANGNKIRQPKGNLNIKDISYEDLQKSMSKDIEIQTPRGTVYRNLDDYTDSLDMGLDPATGKMQSPIYDAKNIDESVRNANKNDTHFTGDMADIGRKNIKDVELDTTINKVHDLVYDEVPTALNKADRVVDGQTIRPINDYLDGLDVKGTIAKGKLKTIQDLANNNFNSLDTKLNSLTRILDDVQTAVPKTTFNKKSQEAIIDAVHHAMFDAFEQAYKTNRIDAVAKKTIDTQLDKLITLKNADGTTSQSLKLVPRKGDSARVMKRSPNHRRQRIEKDRGSPDIERLPANDTPTQNRGLLDADDYETLQDTGSQGYNSGEGANTFKNTYTPASSTRRTKSKDAPKRSKRSKLTSKEEEELMPWLEDLPNYNFKGYR